jgi:1-acyl-sn-glycerol-3-phosphate acyltransferase
VKLRVRPPFPLGPPLWPGSLPLKEVESKVGQDFSTDWARTPVARVARAVIVDDVLAPFVAGLASPQVTGVDRLAALEGAAIFAANHHSHLDTPLMLTTLPEPWRHRAVVAAAADYFFDTRVKGALSALAMGAIPMERTKVSRRSADLAADLVDDGWSLIIFPEGGRSPHGWGQPFRGGAAYLSSRTGRPVVPVHLAGTRRVLRRGATLPTRSTVHVTFGAPLWPADGESASRFASRIEAAVAALADEQATDWWSARQRVAAGTTPSLTGPDAVGWRRTWALGDDRRRRRSRQWPLKST